MTSSKTLVRALRALKEDKKLLTYAKWGIEVEVTFELAKVK
jgi:hypothetical protein